MATSKVRGQYYFYARSTIKETARRLDMATRKLIGSTMTWSCHTCYNVMTASLIAGDNQYQCVKCGTWYDFIIKQEDKMATQRIDRETVMDGATTARKITVDKVEGAIFLEDQLMNIIDRMPLVKPMAYTVYHNLVLVNNKLKDSNGDKRLIKAYDALISLVSKMEPEERIDFNL